MTVVIHTVDDEGILTLTLNRPDKLNALNTEVLQALQESLDEARNNPQIKGVLLTGEGKAFCAGADISHLGDCDAESGYQFARHGQAVLKTLGTLGKPTLAAINGVALGGGCELAIAATLRFASTAARLGQPEVKLGVIPGYGGTQRLARLVGKGRAMDLCLTGRFIDAETALQWGLVTGVYPPEILLDAARKTLKSIMAMAPLAIAGVMDVIEYGYDLPLDTALHLEAVHFAKVCASADKHEGVQAFLSKRPAQFKGR